jgi:DNA-directed RNA polymerase subunit L
VVRTNDYYNYLGGEVIFDETESNFSILEDNIFLPTDFVFDRMDKICYVKPIPQWYIDYANPEWKNMAINCVSNMKLNEYTKNNLIANIDTIFIEPVPNNPFSVNFHIENEDDTLGNVIQSLLHNKYIRDNNKYKGVVCSYIGYICPHPLKQLMIIRVTLEDQTNPEKFKQFLTDNSYEIIKELEIIKNEWIKFNSKKK